MRKVKLTWYDLGEILKRLNGNLGLMPNEEIKEITLMKPKEILIRTEQK